jgi:hypothetical protein
MLQTLKWVGSLFATRPDPFANAKVSELPFADCADVLRDAYGLNCVRPDAHLTVWTVPENICENEYIWLISPVFFTPNTIFLGFTMENRLST